MFKGECYLLEMLEGMDIKGRKKFQKIVHLLEHKGMEPLYRFKYYHYGPYSSDLQLEIDLLVRRKLVAEDIENGAYTYKITETGREFKAQVAGFNEVSFDKGLLAKLNEKDASFLELLSTYAYLLDFGDSEEKARDKALELKPRLEGYMGEVQCFYRENFLARSA